jgi:hypothetical protein
LLGAARLVPTSVVGRAAGARRDGGGAPGSRAGPRRELVARARPRPTARAPVRTAL